jgi:hypothetical protein
LKAGETFEPANEKLAFLRRATNTYFMVFIKRRALIIKMNTRQVKSPAPHRQTTVDRSCIKTELAAKIPKTGY